MMHCITFLKTDDIFCPFIHSCINKLFNEEYSYYRRISELRGKQTTPFAHLCCNLEIIYVFRSVHDFRNQLLFFLLFLTFFKFFVHFVFLLFFLLVFKNLLYSFFFLLAFYCSWQQQKKYMYYTVQCTVYVVHTLVYAISVARGR